MDRVTVGEQNRAAAALVDAGMNSARELTTMADMEVGGPGERGASVSSSSSSIRYIVEPEGSY